MIQRRKISATQQTQVRERAKYLCEYCHCNEQWQYVAFTVDHVMPLQQGGLNDLANLALACFRCNRRKTNKLAAIDPETGHNVNLFNPRQHHWADHFRWSADGLLILPLTSIGRATANLLDFNHERVLQIRLADVLVGRHPPVDDPIEYNS